MKKAFSAFLIAIVCLSVVALHAWQTWGEVDSLHGGSHDDREMFEYSLFLESFAFMISAAYFLGPKIYRLFKEENAAIQFEGQKQVISRLVHMYSGICVVLRRLILDPKIGVPFSETIIVILLICTPSAYSFFKAKYEAIKH